MGSADKYLNLHWDEFQVNIANSLGDLRADGDFLDVTVAIDESHQLQAHKVMLAASSSYFRAMIKRNPSQHPVLVMPPSVRFSELSSLLDFIYYGEVSVHQDDIDSFMNLAELLKVRGLCYDEEKEKLPSPQRIPKMPPGISVRRSGAHVPQAGPSPPKRPRNAAAAAAASTTATAAARQKYQPRRRQQLRPAYLEDEEEEADDFDDDAVGAVEEFESEELVEGGSYPTPPSAHAAQQQQQDLAPKGGTRLIGLQCPQCPARLPGVTAFKEHMAAVHRKGEQQQQAESPSVPCNICDKVFKNQKNMLGHQRRVHKVGAPQQQLQGDPGAPVPSGVAPAAPEARKRGRPRKKVPLAVPEAMETAEAADFEGHEDDYDSQMAAAAPKPIGQVPPAPRGQPPQQAQQQPQQQPQQEQEQPPDAGDHGRQPWAAQGTPFGGAAQNPPRPQRPRPRPSHPVQSRHPVASGSQQRPDLRRIGMKFGGQISITSSEGGPGRTGSSAAAAAAAAQGLSITKLDEEGGKSAVVKDEPLEPYVVEAAEEEEEGDDFDEEGRFAGASYAGGDNVDGMYEGSAYDDDQDVEQGSASAPAP